MAAKRTSGRGARKAGKAKKALQGIERAAKRAEQKAQGALDGRFRERKVPDKKKYRRKPPGADDGS